MYPPSADIGEGGFTLSHSCLTLIKISAGYYGIEKSSSNRIGSYHTDW